MSFPRRPRRAIRKHELPGIYILGPRAVIGGAVERTLRKLGRVRRIAGRAPVETAVAFARYSNATFGWGLRDPGHGLVVANAERTLDAAAGAILSASGKYGPLLLVEQRRRAPALGRELPARHPARVPVRSGPRASTTTPG